MKAAIHSVAVICLLTVFFSQQASTARAADHKLDEKIPKADPKKYKDVRDAKDWANPYLIVRANGVEVVSKGIAKGRKIVATNDLRKTLTSLPITAWPYGKVAAVQEIGIRSGKDEAPIKQNKKSVQEILKALEVTVELWPSA